MSRAPVVKQHYVAGFRIDPEARTVVLIRKGKPEWQKGRLNGVGGKIEPTEVAPYAMRREFREEAGVDIADWDMFAVVQGLWGSVSFLRSFGPTSGVRTMESEPIEVHDLERVPWDQCLPNLSWLLPLALYIDDAYDPVVAAEIACAHSQEELAMEVVSGPPILVCRGCGKARPAPVRLEARP